jgi:SRSO17 transposase
MRQPGRRVDEALSWRVPAPPVLAADAGYGDAGGFRHGLSERDIPYAVQISVTPQRVTRDRDPYRRGLQRAWPAAETAL